VMEVKKMIKYKKIWQSWVKANKDPYGKCCVDVAREVMKLLDDGKHEDFDPNKIITEAENKLIERKEMTEEEGITGFMAGCIAQMISKCHSRGEEFKKKWNESYALNEEDKKRKNAINPALVTIKFDEK